MKSGTEQRSGGDFGMLEEGCGMAPSYTDPAGRPIWRPCLAAYSCFNEASLHWAKMWKKTKKSSNSASQIRGGEGTPQPGRWHAVSIITDRYCCEAARGLIARRFLALEAPRLPLTGCAAPEHCGCKYRHHADRRGPPRRKEDISGLRRREPDGMDRRVGQSRRAEDLA